MYTVLLLVRTVHNFVFSYSMLIIVGAHIGGILM